MFDHMTSIRLQRIMWPVAACRRVFVSVGHQWEAFRFGRSHAKLLLPAPEPQQQDCVWPPGCSLPALVLPAAALTAGPGPAPLDVFVSCLCDIIHTEYGQCWRPDARHSSSAPHRILLLPVNTPSGRSEWKRTDFVQTYRPKTWRALVFWQS